MSEQEQWLIVKRDLYYRPDRCGYTGIRDHAGRYSQAEAEAEAQHDGITAIRLADAPEFSKACYPDLALKHVIKQRDALLKLAEAVKPLAWLARQHKHDPRCESTMVAVGRLRDVTEALETAGRLLDGREHNEMPERANG